jgi:transcriptional regulator with XRE-family HTH domain
MPSSPLTEQHDPGVPAVSTQLARYVRAWRLRLDPELLPGLRPDWTHSQRRRTVSQEEIARLVSCSTQWFARLERGYIKEHSDAFIHAVAQVLRLDVDEARMLRLLTGKEPAAPTPGGTRTEDLQSVLMAQPWPAYIRDNAWNVAGYNDEMRALFPWVQDDDANVMRWVFTHPDARRRLHQWGTEWAPPMLAQLRAEQLRHPGDHRLVEIIRDILDASVEAQRLWEETLVKFHPDGDRRSICLPGQPEPHRVQIVALEPLRAPGTRLIILVPATA